MKRTLMTILFGIIANAVMLGIAWAVVQMGGQPAVKEFAETCWAGRLLNISGLVWMLAWYFYGAGTYVRWCAK